MKSICQILVCLLAAVSPALAFQPAPYYTLYGMVRDQVGQTVTGQGAEIVLLKGGAEIGRMPIRPTMSASFRFSPRRAPPPAGFSGLQLGDGGKAEKLKS